MALLADNAGDLFAEEVRQHSFPGNIRLLITLLCGCMSNRVPVTRQAGCEIGGGCTVQVVKCMDRVEELEDMWGVTFFHYDWFSATRTSVAREVKYDTFITVSTVNTLHSTPHGCKSHTAYLLRNAVCPAFCTVRKHA